MSRRSWTLVTLAQVVLLVVATVALTAQSSTAASPAETQEMLAIATAVTQARETCYSAPDCPNLEELMALFSERPRRTEIQRDNNVVLLEGPEALRADHLRVAGRFTGRQLETTAVMVQGRNVIVLQRNWDPGAPEPTSFVSTFRIEGGKVAHWILVAP